VVELKSSRTELSNRSKDSESRNLDLLYRHGQRKMSNDIQLYLTAEEVNGILNMLAEMPTKTNAWPVMQKIQQQVKDQTYKPEAE
jgi:hypothetical protein